MALASLLFVLLSALGSWRAWRRSPAYSLKTTLQVFGVCAAILAFFLVIARAPLPDGERAALAIGGTLLCLLGAPALILRFTDGRVAALPPSIQLLSTHRLKVQHWIWRLLALLAVCAGTTLVLKGDLIWLPITLGGFLGLCAGSTLIALYLRATRLDRGLSVVLDAPWLRWRYTPEEWQAWAMCQRRRDESENAGFSWRRDWRKYAKIFSQLLPSLFLGSWLAFKADLTDRILISLGLTVILELLFVAMAVSAHANNERRYQKTIATVPDTYIGEEGIYSGGEFTPWSLSGSYLVEAVTESGPPNHIRFVFQSNISETKTVLIPAGHEGDLELLQQELHAKAPKAPLRIAVQAEQRA